jgi:hypothetical protein
MMPSASRIQFSISFPNIPAPLSGVWRTLTSFLKEQECLPDIFEFSQIAGHPESKQSEQYLKLSPEEVTSLLNDRELNGFQVSTGHSASSIDFSLLNALHEGVQSTLDCRIGLSAIAPNSWAPFVESILRLHAGIGGWQWGHLYRCWQWAERIDDLYEKQWGAIPPGYRIRKLPPPISLTPQPEVGFADVSRNPGRIKALAFRVNFYPTAEMWLGPHFWQYATCTKEEALAADFFIEKRDTPHYLYLKCWPEPFTRPDGEQGRMQQRLWKLFFNEDCEWPPGSGTICDEPMYGPPELMPAGADHQSKAAT